MTRNLYDIPAEGAEPQAWCGGNLGGNNETCVSVAEIPDAPGSFIVQDTKAEGSGRELRFTADELTTFATGWLTSRGHDSLTAEGR